MRIPKEHLDLIDKQAWFYSARLQSDGFAYDRADLFSDFQWVYLRARETYEAPDTRHTAKFKTYIVAAFRNYVADLCRKLIREARLKRELENNPDIAVASAAYEQPDELRRLEERDLISLFDASLDRVIVSEILRPSKEVMDASKALATKNRNNLRKGKSSLVNFNAIRIVYGRKWHEMHESMKRIRATLGTRYSEDKERLNIIKSFC